VLSRSRTVMVAYDGATNRSVSLTDAQKAALQE